MISFNNPILFEQLVLEYYGDAEPLCKESIKEELSLVKVRKASTELSALPQNLKKPFACFDSCIYMSTNEISKKAREILGATKSTVASGCHFGFSGWYNFEVAGLRNSKLVIMADYDPETNAFHRKTIELLKVCPTAEIFKETIKKLERSGEISQIMTNLKYQQFGLYPENLSNSKKDRSIRFQIDIDLELWLKSDKAYTQIRELALDGRIVVLNLNACGDDSTFKKIHEIFCYYQISLDTLNISNIYYVYGPTSANSIQFERNFAPLIQDDTLVIQSYSVPIDRELLQTKYRITCQQKQYVFPGKNLITGQRYTPSNFFTEIGESDKIESQVAKIITLSDITQEIQLLTTS
jgi:hypothetical protein